MNWQPTLPERAIVKGFCSTPIRPRREGPSTEVEPRTLVGTAFIGSIRPLIEVFRLSACRLSKGLIPLGLICGIATCLFAIGLARIVPGPERARIPAAPLFEAFNGVEFGHQSPKTCLLDVTNGSMDRFSLPEGERLQEASCSPWHDEQGEYQVIGQWTQAEANGSFTKAVGVARYSLPSGRFLDLVPLDVTLAGRPCWFPGPTARVLYTGNDGKIYRIDFDGKTSSEGPRPSRIAWTCPEPGPNLDIRHPVWPRDPRMKGKLVVSLSFSGQRSGRENSTCWKLWWLSLSGDGSAVTAAGPMGPCGPGQGRNDDLDSGPDESRPNLATTPDGGMVLAYLVQSRTPPNWHLRLVDVTFDPTTGDPAVNQAASRLICENHQAERALFSPDGGSLFAITRTGVGATEVVRFPIKKLLALGTIDDKLVTRSRNEIDERVKGR